MLEGDDLSGPELRPGYKHKVLHWKTGFWRRVSALFDRVERFSNSRLKNAQNAQRARRAREAAVIASTDYNMRESPGEDYYASQYWKSFEQWLPHPDTCPVVLDLGCGQGRFIFRFAEIFRSADITGIDVSPSAISNARQYAEAQGFRKVKLVVADIKEYVDGLAPESLDIVLYTEVALFDPEWMDFLSVLKSRIKPGGILIASFRSSLFNALVLAAEGRVHDARVVLSPNRQGQLWAGNPIEYAWTDSAELRDLFASRGCTILSLTGIGCLSGIPGDPLASILQPGLMSSDEREALMELEVSFGPLVPDASRYILAVIEV